MADQVALRMRRSSAVLLALVLTWGLWTTTSGPALNLVRTPALGAVPSPKAHHRVARNTVELAANEQGSTKRTSSSTSTYSLSHAVGASCCPLRSELDVSLTIPASLRLAAVPKRGPPRVRIAGSLR